MCLPDRLCIHYCRHIMRYNSEVPSTKEHYDTLGKILFANNFGSNDKSTVSFGDQFEQLSIDLKLPQKLREVGVLRSDIPRMAEMAMQQTRLLPNNPRIIEYNDALKLYSEAW